MCQADFSCSLSPLAQRVHAYLVQRASHTDPSRPFTGRIAYSELLHGPRPGPPLLGAAAVTRA